MEIRAGEDFREDFLAVYAKRRKSLRSKVEVHFTESDKPSLELALVLKTPNRFNLNICICKDKRVWGSIVRTKKPNRGSSALRFWMNAIDASSLFLVVLELITYAKRLPNNSTPEAAKRLIRDSLTLHCNDVCVTF